MENLFGIMPFQNPHKTFLLITFSRSGFGFITFVILSSAIAFDARGQEIICSTGAISLSPSLVSVNSFRARARPATMKSFEMTKSEGQREEVL